MRLCAHILLSTQAEHVGAELGALLWSSLPGLMATPTMCEGVVLRPSQCFERWPPAVTQGVSGESWVNSMR